MPKSSYLWAANVINKNIKLIKNLNRNYELFAI